MVKAKTKPVSPSGRFSVSLNATFPDNDFTYKPRHDEIIVDQALFDRMWAAGVVDVAHAVADHDQPAA